MNYTIILASQAEKELYKLQKTEIQKIVSSIDSLQNNPRPKGYKNQEAYLVSGEGRGSDCSERPPETTT